MHNHTRDWEFRVDGQPPSVNHLYVRVRGSWDKMAKAKGVAQYQEDVMWLCKAARPSGWKPSPGGYVRLGFRFHLARDADCDNLLKVIQDAVAMALGINDRIVLPCVIEKTVGSKSPYTVIEVGALPSSMQEREGSSASGSPPPSPRPSGDPSTTLQTDQ